MKSLTIISGKAMIVEMPEGAPTPDVINTGQPHLSWLDIDINLPDIDLPSGTWQIVGMLSEVTEEQADVMVESDEQYGVTMYRNYKTTGMPYYDEQITALESLESAIRAEGYHLDVNPIPEPHLGEGVSDDWVTDYNNAQSRVLCRERCLVLRMES